MRAIPITTDVFGHRKGIGAAIWVFLWMAANASSEGLVLGGMPMPANRVAAALDIPLCTARGHLRTLLNGGYISVIDPARRQGRGYVITAGNLLGGTIRTQEELEAMDPVAALEKELEAAGRLTESMWPQWEQEWEARFADARF